MVAKPLRKPPGKRHRSDWGVEPDRGALPQERDQRPGLSQEKKDQRIALFLSDFEQQDLQNQVLVLLVSDLNGELNPLSSWCCNSDPSVRPLGEKDTFRAPLEIPPSKPPSATGSLQEQKGPGHRSTFGEEVEWTLSSAAGNLYCNQDQREPAWIHYSQVKKAPENAWTSEQVRPSTTKFSQH
ncbi:hypothetical protein BTVI_86828 [Pitangus sulphuratus]|nr:hypothetical protein BTVI_86828 [Pitangus sulphuratus]